MNLAPSKILLDELFGFLASAPSLEQIAAFRFSDELDARIHDLLDKNGRGQITPEESEELENFLRYNHFMKMFKAWARLKLAGKA